MNERRDYIGEGEREYEEWRSGFLADAENRRIYEEESQKKALWLQLVEARQAAGLTQAEVARRMGVSQAQVARIEKRGYEAYTLRTLRRYLQALSESNLTSQLHGVGLRLSVQVEPQNSAPGAAATLAESQTSYGTAETTLQRVLSEIPALDQQELGQVQQAVQALLANDHRRTALSGRPFPRQSSDRQKSQ
jgi:transcriptional regulator with XRE-family HTH domain